jgi:type II secretory pathway pseudopilin PulG
MQPDQKQFSLIERFVVLAIILLVAVIAIQNILHSVRASEDRTLSNAAVEYVAVKNMYAEQRQTLPPSLVRANGTGAVNTHNTPIH